MHFWCFLRTQFTAPDSLSAVWWHAAARANCLLLWKFSDLTEQCPQGRTTLLNGKAFLFRCFHRRWKLPIKILVMKILDCASITAYEPSMYHYRVHLAQVWMPSFLVGYATSRLLFVLSRHLLLELIQGDTALPLKGHRKLFWNLLQCTAFCFALQGAAVISAGG